MVVFGGKSEEGEGGGIVFMMLIWTVMIIIKMTDMRMRRMTRTLKKMWAIIWNILTDERNLRITMSMDVRC